MGSVIGAELRLLNIIIIISKYEELAIQLKNIWKLSNVTIHPIIISVEGVVSKQLTKTIEELALPSSIARIGQKAILLQTCHIVRKFLN